MGSQSKQKLESYDALTWKHRLAFRAFRGVATAIGILDRITGVAGRRNGALIYPPSGPGSLGDEAMANGVAESLRAAGVSPVKLFARRGVVEWPSIPGVERYEREPASAIASLARLLKLFRRYRYVFVVGADCIDGHYAVQNSVRLLTVVDAAARAGCVSTLLGSSFSDRAHPDSCEALRHMSHSARICARDPVSQDRIASVTGRTPLLVADAAFLVEPVALSTQLDPLADWIEAQRDRKRIILGVNFNHQVFPHGTPAEKVDALLESFAVALKTMADESPDLSVLLIPHDYRGANTDPTYAARLHERLAPDLGDRLMTVPGRCVPGEIAAIVDRIDAVFSARMHLAILSFNRGKPVACVRYQGKFIGLFRHFGLDDLYLSGDEATDPARLKALLKDLIDYRDAISILVRSGLPRTRELARLNLPEKVRPPTSDTSQGVWRSLPTSIDAHHAPALATNGATAHQSSRPMQPKLVH